MLFDEVRQEFEPPARCSWRDIATFADHHGMFDGFLQEVDVLYELRLGVTGNRDLIPHPVVLDHVAKSDAAAVRTNRYAELCRHQNNRHHVIDAGNSNSVNLAILDRSAL